MIDTKWYFIIKSILLVGFLAYFSYEDIKEKSVSNKAIVFMAAAGLLCAGITVSLDVILRSVICAAATGSVAFVTELLSRGGLGRGDVLILAAVGLYVGDLSILMIVFVSLAALCLFSIAGLIFKKINMHSRLPYIPFLLLGVIIGSLL